MNFSHRSISGLCGSLALFGIVLASILTPAANGDCSPARLQAKIAEIAQATHGPVGAAVRGVEGSQTIALHGEQRLPMQSVYKLPIAMAVLHQVDLGKLSLNQPVLIRPSDLVPPSRYSPIRGKYPNGTTMTLSELLAAAVTVSDGTASDVLIQLAGGPKQITAYLRGIGIQNMVIATTEKDMAQDEQAQYRNWATPNAMLTLLCTLQQGKVLSAASRHLLLDLLAQSQTGPHQIRGLLPVGTVVAHKTGSSGTINGLTRATNDAGLITLPDGRHLAVVVFVSDTRANATTRDRVIAKIARAAWDCRTALESSK